MLGCLSAFGGAPLEVARTLALTPPKFVHPEISCPRLGHHAPKRSYWGSLCVEGLLGLGDPSYPDALPPHSEQTHRGGTARVSIPLLQSGLTSRAQHRSPFPWSRLTSEPQRGSPSPWSGLTTEAQRGSPSPRAASPWSRSAGPRPRSGLTSEPQRGSPSGSVRVPPRKAGSSAASTCCSSVVRFSAETHDVQQSVTCPVDRRAQWGTGPPPMLH